MAIWPKEVSTMPTTINPKLVSWASDIEAETIRQAEKTARLPIVEGHVALMADAHVGIGAGLGRGHDKVASRAGSWLADHRPATDLSTDQMNKAASQFGTLGSGNHFFELCVDERARVWVVLHSGSRGIGNQLAQLHIAKARRLAREAMLSLEDPDLAWFVQGTPEFDAYVTDMLWAQEYARANRDQMMDNAMGE